MLIIRPAQMEVFREEALRSFEKEMVVHLRNSFPTAASEMNDSALLSAIQAGIRKAASYGIKRVPDVRTFLEYVICYGPNFDVDPTTEWAGQVLRDKTRNPSEKMHLLARLQRKQ
jgi:hypothetical protein